MFSLDFVESDHPFASKSGKINQPSSVSVNGLLIFP